MKRELATAAARRLACDVAGAEVTEDALLRALAGIALGNGKAVDRLRAIELLGRYKGMFREEKEKGASFAELVLASQRMREQRQAALRLAPGPIR